MKTSFLTAGAVAALAVIVGGSAVAQQASARPGQSAAPAPVSRADYIQARVDRLSAIDANRDGSVSAEERRSGIETRRNQRQSNRFEKLDANGDGVLSREEFTSGQADRPQRAGRQRMGRPAQRAARAERVAAPVSIAEAQTRAAERFDRMDTNRDGYLTAEERRAARAAGREARQARHAERMARAAAASSSAPASE